MFCVKFFQKMRFAEVNSFKKYGGRCKIYMVTYIKISMKFGLLN